MSWLGDLLARLRRPEPPPAPPQREDDAEMRRWIMRILDALQVPDAAAWTEALIGPCRERGIATPKRLAAFLAQCAHESGGFRRLRESLDYTPEALLATWPRRFDAASAEAMGRRPGKPADQRAIAERAYGGRMGNGPEGSGDGWRYRGAGIMQVTGRANCAEIATARGMPVEQVPDWLTTREGAAWGAAWFWGTRGLNALADAGDFDAITVAINGGMNGADDRRRRYSLALAALGSRSHE
jgi:putative chitinase